MLRSKVQSSVAVRRPWTPADDALLAQLLQEGKDFGEMAARLKRTVASVQRRAGDLRARAAFRKPER